MWTGSMGKKNAWVMNLESDHAESMLWEKVRAGCSGVCHGNAVAQWGT